MLRRKNSAWSAVYDRIEGAPSRVWMGLPLSKLGSRRLVNVMCQHSEGIATHIRNHREFGLMEIEVETLPDHNVVWLRKMN